MIDLNEFLVLPEAPELMILTIILRKKDIIL